ncbi:MAG: hypothetical protein OEY44_02055 [Candidatus Peregrinibacteria bacterium]|nr:hypothetical protein [Candidatus Peregrinibacteria bacterium]
MPQRISETIILADFTPDDIAKMLEQGAQPDQEQLKQAFPEAFKQSSFLRGADREIEQLRDQIEFGEGEEGAYLEVLINDLFERFKGRLGGMDYVLKHECDQQSLTTRIGNVNDVIEALERDIDEIEVTFRGLETMKRARASIDRLQERLKKEDMSEKAYDHAQRRIESEEEKIRLYLQSIRDADLTPGKLAEELRPLNGFYGKETSPYKLEMRLVKALHETRTFEIPEPRPSLVPSSRPPEVKGEGAAEVEEEPIKTPEAKEIVSQSRLKSRLAFGAALVLGTVAIGGAYALRKAGEGPKDEKIPHVVLPKKVIEAVPSASSAVPAPVVDEAGAPETGTPDTQDEEVADSGVKLVELISKEEQEEFALVSRLREKVFEIEPSLKPDHLKIKPSGEFRAGLEKIHGTRLAVGLERHHVSGTMADRRSLPSRLVVSKGEYCADFFDEKGVVAAFLRKPGDYETLGVYPVDMSGFQKIHCSK